MSASEEMEGQKSARIRFELASLGMKPGDAKQLVKNGLFDAYSPVESMRIIGGLSSLMGDYYAALLIQTSPIIALAYAHRAAPCHAILTARGFRASDASRLICLHAHILEASDEEIVARLDALRALLPNDSTFRFFLNKQTAAITLPSEHLRSRKPVWRDDPEDFYTGVSAGYDPRTAPPVQTNGVLHPTAAPTIARPIRDTLSDRLERLGVQGADLIWMTSRFERAFAARAESVLQAFEGSGWSGSDILALTKNHNHRGWRKDPELLLEAERALVIAGFEATTARDLVITIDRFTRPHTERIPLAADAFRELGHANDLEMIARKNPKAFFETPEKIRIWHAAMKITGCDPLAFLGSLTRYMPSVKPKKAVAPKPLPATETKPEVGDPILFDEPVIVETATAVVPCEPVPPPVVAPPLPTVAPEIPVMRNPRPVRAAQEDAEEDSHITNWRLALRELLGHTQDEDDEPSFDWKAFEKTNGWIWDPAGPGPAALNVLARWLNITNIGHQHNDSTLLLKRIVTDKTLRWLLKLPPEVLHHRLAAMSAILCQDFRKKPELLLLAWEKFPPRELRYRVNEINDRGKKAHLKPYIQMLLEPTREKFLGRLNAFLRTY
ncbi:MAG: hypothetical protein WA001_03510 [Patescibacteria group bacterium]